MKKTYTVFMFLFLIAQVSFASTVTEKLKEIKNFDIPEDIEFSRIVKVVDGVEIVGISCRKKGNTKAKEPAHLFGHGFSSKATFWLRQMTSMCQQGHRSFAFNMMEHGSDFEIDGIGRSRVINGRAELAHFDYLMGYVHETVKHVVKATNNSPIVYHGHSMGHMTFENYSAGFYKDRRTGEYIIDESRKSWVSKHVQAAIYHGGPVDFTENQKKFSILALAGKDPNRFAGIFNALLGASSKVGDAKKEARAGIKDKVKKKFIELGKPLMAKPMNFLVDAVLDFNNFTVDDLKFLMHHGSSNRVSPVLVGSVNEFVQRGYQTETGIKYNLLKNNDIPQLLIYGKKDWLASSPEAVMNFVQTKPTANQIMLVFDDFSHLDIALGNAYETHIQPFERQFLTTGIDDQLKQRVKSKAGVTYIAGGENLNLSCLKYVKSSLNSGRKAFKKSTLDVKKLLAQ